MKCLAMKSMIVSMLTAVSAGAAEFHVATTGSDANPGTAEQPFATLERARDAVRATPPVAGATVWLHAGTYFLASAFELNGADSGTVYRSVEGAAVRLSGGRQIAATDFQPVTDTATLVRLAPAARGKIVVLDLKALGVRHCQSYADTFTDNGGLVELYFNGRRLPLSRFPNQDYMTMKRILDNAGGPTNRDWRTHTDWHKVTASGTGGTFEYREEFTAQHARWRNVLDRGVWLKGYWRIPWQNETSRIKSIDTEKHTVTLAKPIPGGIGSKYHRPEGSGQEKYWLMNLLEEVDLPGEWCVDFAAAKLYLYPPAPLAGAAVVLADNAAPVIRVANAERVVLRQLIVEGGLGHGIEISGGADNLVAGCTVRNVSRYGVALDGGFRHTVQSCDLYDLGAGGVWLGGGDENAAPRVPAGHRVINNHIHHFAQIERVYAPGVNAGFTGGGNGGHHPAVGMLVAHNLIHDTPHAGVLFGSWDSVFEYNEVLAFCQVSNDMGGFYSYDKYETMGNHTFRYNYVHSSGDGDALYFDHDHRDMHLYGNIVCLDSTGKRGTAYLYKGGSQTKNPQTLDCHDNIAINSNFGFEFVTARPSRIENNVAVNCKAPFNWQEVKDGKIGKGDDSLASGKNMTYAADPGFVDMAAHDFRLKPDAQLLKDLPNFQPPPFPKMGLYLDEYRRQLPSAAEAGRVRTDKTGGEVGYEVLDRN